MLWDSLPIDVSTVVTSVVCSPGRHIQSLFLLNGLEAGCTWLLATRRCENPLTYLLLCLFINFLDRAHRNQIKLHDAETIPGSLICLYLLIRKPNGLIQDVKSNHCLLLPAWMSDLNVKQHLAGILDSTIHHYPWGNLAAEVHSQKDYLQPPMPRKSFITWKPRLIKVVTASKR